MNMNFASRLRTRLYSSGAVAAPSTRGEALGDRRPLAVLLDALPDALVLQDVDTIKFHAGGVQHAADLLREAALGLLRG